MEEITQNALEALARLERRTERGEEKRNQRKERWKKHGGKER